MATWVGYPRSYTKGRLRPVQYVVVHNTAGTEGPNSAEAGAAYDKVRTDGTSTHLFIDSDSALREVPDTDRAHHARQHGNQIGLGVELCGGARQTDAQWHDAASLATLRLSAREVAQLCYDHDLPVRRLSVSEVRAAYYAPAGQRPKGICGHIDVTMAYPEDAGDHTDPGPGFPWTEFLAMVAAELAVLKGDDVSAEEVWAYKLPNPAVLVDGKPRMDPARDFLTYGNNYAAAAAAKAAEAVELLEEVKALLQAGGTPAPGSGATPEQVRQIVDEELDEQSRAGADAD